jgi:hypothetical protein
VSWRGVLDNNVRDIFVGTSSDQGVTWGTGKRVAEDNWVLNGCPHSGAAMSAIGKRLFLAWHTVRENQNKLYLSYSDDGGATFSGRIDASQAVVDPNHPFLLSMGDRVAMVFQGREAAGGGWGKIQAWYREFDAKGQLSPIERIGNVAGSVSYPTLTVEQPGRLFVAWTEPREEEKVVVLSRGRRVAAITGAAKQGASRGQ